MLVCGEDLGMIPECVPPRYERSFHLSLEIERMPKDPREFEALQNIPLPICLYHFYTRYEPYTQLVGRKQKSYAALF